LDAELLLSYVLKKPREFLLAHPETELAKAPFLMQLEEFLERRLKREPLAYITGQKEFYGRMFQVDKNVLIPRPESETIIELLRQLPLQKGSVLVDVGTGSGILAITAKLEMPALRVIATDISGSALELARKNARLLHADISFAVSNLLESTNISLLDVIVANLPYVDASWEVSPETAYEPNTALFAKDGGLFLIKRLIAQTIDKLCDNGSLFLEADPRQHDEIAAYASKYGLRLAAKDSFVFQFIKI
jgi:release factor glutamine methyltransferase